MSLIESERRRIIQRLIKKLTAGEFAGLSEDYLTTASKYTGLHPKVLKELETSDEFEAWIEPLDRSVIYNKLTYFYTSRNKIPNTLELFSALHGEIAPYIDIGNFRKILVKMDFVWKKTSPTTAVVIENPLVRFERYNYLKKIQVHRSSGSDIYYIDSNSYDFSGQFRDHKLTKEFIKGSHSSIPIRKVWVQRVIYALGPNGINALEELTAFSSEEVEEWVRDALIPKIEKPSVFVLKSTDHHNGKLLETPTLDSLKTDTIRWLERHGITYDPRMSKYELFALAEKYTDLSMDLFKIDQTLKIKGHSVLRIPKCIENVTSAALLYRVMNETFPETVQESALNPENQTEELKQLFRDVIRSSASTYIDEFEGYIAKNEDDMVAMDNKVDEVYDGLIKKSSSAKQKDAYVDSDLPSCSDSE